MNMEGKGHITCKLLTTPIGEMLGGANEDGICFLEYVTFNDLESRINHLADSFQTIINTGNNSWLIILEEQLSQYFEGRSKKFDIPLILTGTNFQKRVWEELLNIPYGVTLSYLVQTLKLGKAGAIRAVASANGKNRIAILIPCHRVVGKNGNLTGYTGGLERKQWLLSHEKMVIGEQIRFE